MNTRSKKQKLQDIGDIDRVLRALELGSGAAVDGDSSCNCMGLRHPLNEIIPNCLNCGKIICLKEGLRPCSFCHEPLISLDEKLKMIDILNTQKYSLMENKGSSNSQNTGNAGKGGKKKSIKLSMGKGTKSLFNQQDIAFKRIEKQNQLEKAKQNLDNLLNYQNTSEERTKIIDQVADYGSNNTNSHAWSSSLSTLEKILLLKKQQQNLRKQKLLSDSNSGRPKQVLDLSIKNGKVITRYQTKEAASNDSTYYDSDDLEDVKMKNEIGSLETQIKIENLSRLNESCRKTWNYEDDQKQWLQKKEQYKKILSEDSHSSSAFAVSGAPATSDATNQKFKRLQLDPPSSADSADSAEISKRNAPAQLLAL
ncbi:zf-C2HC5-domain-containing protein [Ascoidea rubescens DSM 1968]|uniref:Zf-C2HC5-domain-containing protein n=1 Tax=Ascoidea rubescens DSM 1968 TaxID=1344418 RepID=A0A1D2VQ63_9ASCO|nr:zf-C2HC5-domain-containing protein [Ascoidea rubescens DSM 1968]ODV63751.1 zf-C2HC5-domain-containing protein [Ascoidea rubescens DSM 1968]